MGQKEKNLENVVFSRFFVWLRGQESNLRPPGYEPDELPTALPRDIEFETTLKTDGAGNRARTGTRGKPHWILSPGRLPIPPLRRSPLDYNTTNPPCCQYPFSKKARYFFDLFLQHHIFLFILNKLI